MSTTVSDHGSHRYQKRAGTVSKLEKQYCSWGDTVQLSRAAEVLRRRRRPYLYEREGFRNLDLQSVVLSGRVSATGTSVE